MAEPAAASPAKIRGIPSFFAGPLKDARDMFDFGDRTDDERRRLITSPGPVRLACGRLN